MPFHLPRLSLEAVRLCNISDRARSYSALQQANGLEPADDSDVR